MARLLTLLLIAVCAMPTQAPAQAYPAKAVRIIVPFPPGQAADIFARMVGDRLSQVWGQPVFVENRAGGGGVPGIMAGKQAAPDGYTLLVGTSGTLGVNPGIYAKLPYDPITDFLPASNIFIVPLVVVAHPGFKPANIQELVAAARAQPGTINYASAGPGTAQRAPQLPEVPTVAEAGYAGFEGAGWSGFVLPAGTPRAVVDKVSADTQAVLREPQMRDRIVERGGIPDPRTPQEYGEFIKAEIAKWSEVARVARVRLD